MNAFQKAALRVYASGEFSYLTGPDPDCGDTLLHFILIELSDNEDCEDLNTAIQRMTSAVNDLETIIEALK